jgi:serine/threonine-protein kinase
MNAETRVPVRPGDILAGKYRVERVLGMGAMGVVVAATHLDLQELRAIKFMMPSELGDAEGAERFLREARAAARLKSQHVTKIHDVGRLEPGSPAPGCPYIIMEHLAGCDLKRLLRMHGPRPVSEAATYVLQACEALAEAHALGIVHRDLKPANLFLTSGPNGGPCVKVLDFGIAKVTGGTGADGAPAMDVTSTSALMGSPLYMSPEQMRSTRDVDGRADLWSLGIILYELCTGRVPFAGTTITQVCAAVIGDRPAAPSALRADLPPAFEAVILRCLEKDVAFRFATALELAAALRPFTLAAAPPAVTPPPAASPAAALPAPGLPPDQAATQMWTRGAPEGADEAPTVARSSGALNTARGTAWGQTTGSTARPASRRGLLVGAVVTVGLVGALATALVVTRGSAAGDAAPATTGPAPASPSAAASAGLPPPLVATATAAPEAPSAAPSATASTKATAKPAVAPRPRGKTLGPNDDAFGTDRK